MRRKHKSGGIKSGSIHITKVVTVIWMAHKYYSHAVRDWVEQNDQINLNIPDSTKLKKRENLQAYIYRISDRYVRGEGSDYRAKTTKELDEERNTAFVAAIDENLRRETKWFYPLEAVRESLINALAHRDWTRFVEIEVASYSDRFEVISPGTLPNSMTIEKMKAGQRSPRNTLIMEVLRDYGYVDYRGMGVRTKIVPLTRARSRYSRSHASAWECITDLHTLNNHIRCQADLAFRRITVVLLRVREAIGL